MPLRTQLRRTCDALLLVTLLIGGCKPKPTIAAEDASKTAAPPPKAEPSAVVSAAPAPTLTPAPAPSEPSEPPTQPAASLLAEGKGPCPHKLADIPVDEGQHLVVIGCLDSEETNTHSDEKQTQSKGRIELYDASRKKLDTKTLPAGLVGAQKLDLYGTGRPVFAISHFELPCMGSYNCGPRSEFFEIADGKLVMLEATSMTSKKTQPISLTQSLNVRWFSDKARSRKGIDLYQTLYQPDFSNPDASPPYNFKTTGVRYTFEGGRWVSYAKQIPDADERPPLHHFP